MNFQRFTLAVAALVIGATANVLPAQQTVILTGDDDFVFRGCVRRANLQTSAPANIIVWSQGDIMLDAATALGAGAPNPIGTSGMLGRVFYWLDAEDDLANHIGWLVEVEGNLEDFETGEVEIERDGDFTEIEVELDGREETARMPTSWLGVIGGDHDREFDIATRRVDVHNVRLLGACN